MAKANLSVIVGVAAAVGLGIFLLANQSKAEPKKDEPKPDIPPKPECPKGLVSVGGQCVDPNPVDPVEPDPDDCPEDQIRGSDGECYDPGQGNDPEIPCPPGLIRAANGKDCILPNSPRGNAPIDYQPCPENHKRDEAGNCIPDEPKDPGPQGCSTGYRRDADGNCIPIGGLDIECSPGYRMTLKQDGGFGCCSEEGPTNVILSDGTCA